MEDKKELLGDKKQSTKIDNKSQKQSNIFEIKLDFYKKSYWIHDLSIFTDKYRNPSRVSGDKEIIELKNGPIYEFEIEDKRAYSDGSILINCKNYNLYITILHVEKGRVFLKLDGLIPYNLKSGTIIGKLLKIS